MNIICINNVNLTFRPSMDYSKSVVLFDERSKQLLKNDLINSERRHDLDKLYEDGIYSYNNNDYLYLYSILNKLIINYNVNYDIDILSEYFSKEVLEKEGMYSDCEKYKLPYVHIVIDGTYSGIACSDITDWGSDEAPVYIIKFNYEVIREYLDFLITLFDPLYNNEKKKEDEQCFILTLDEKCSKIIINDFNKNYPYINLKLNDRNLKIMKLQGQGKDNKFLAGKVPALYLTKGFEKFCTDTDNLISQLYNYSINSIIAHELAHIGNGHNKFKLDNSELIENNNDINHILEYDADTTALRWILSEDFMNGKEGPFGVNINITIDDLVESLKLKVISYYIVLRWKNINDDNPWNKGIIKKMIELNKLNTHPLYQLRIFQMLSNAFQRLDELLELSNKDKIRTSDGKYITKTIIEEIKNDVLNMIASFEYVLLFADEDVNEDNIREKFIDVVKDVDDDIKNCFKAWSQISGILTEYSYCKINKYNIY